MLSNAEQVDIKRAYEALEQSLKSWIPDQEYKRIKDDIDQVLGSNNLIEQIRDTFSIGFIYDNLFWIIKNRKTLSIQRIQDSITRPMKVSAQDRSEIITNCREVLGVDANLVLYLEMIADMHADVTDGSITAAYEVGGRITFHAGPNIRFSKQEGFISESRKKIRPAKVYDPKTGKTTYIKEKAYELRQPLSKIVETCNNALQSYFALTHEKGAARSPIKYMGPDGILCSETTQKDAHLSPIKQVIGHVMSGLRVSGGKVEETNTLIFLDASRPMGKSKVYESHAYMELNKSGNAYARTLLPVNLDRTINERYNAAPVFIATYRQGKHFFTDTILGKMLYGFLRDRYVRFGWINDEGFRRWYGSDKGKYILGFLPSWEAKGETADEVRAKAKSIYQMRRVIEIFYAPYIAICDLYEHTSYLEDKALTETTKPGLMVQEDEYRLQEAKKIIYGAEAAGILWFRLSQGLLAVLSVVFITLITVQATLSFRISAFINF